jgi:hypothetical protein
LSIETVSTQDTAASKESASVVLVPAMGATSLPASSTSFSQTIFETGRVKIVSTQDSAAYEEWATSVTSVPTMGATSLFF